MGPVFKQNPFFPASDVQAPEAFLHPDQLVGKALKPVRTLIHEYSHTTGYRPHHR